MLSIYCSPTLNEGGNVEDAAVIILISQGKKQRLKTLRNVTKLVRIQKRFGNRSCEL